MWFFFPSTVSSKVITCKVNHMVCIYLLFSVQGIFYDILLFNNQLIICTHLFQLGGFQEKLTNKKKKIVEYWATNLCPLWNLSLFQIKSIYNYLYKFKNTYLVFVFRIWRVQKISTCVLIQHWYWVINLGHNWNESTSDWGSCLTIKSCLCWRSFPIFSWS